MAAMENMRFSFFFFIKATWKENKYFSKNLLCLNSEVQDSETAERQRIRKIVIN